MKRIALPVLVLLSLNVFAGGPNYPLNPDPVLTPGSLCNEPDRYRYPEQIPYCEREVNSYTKEIIFSNYRRERGFRLNSDRSLYKIDHFISLCAGGSNNTDNLWPQHASISVITDPIESKGCEKLSQGLITQKDLVDLIRKAKLNLDQAPKILKYLKSLR
jgi:hypothetical protein